MVIRIVHCTDIHLDKYFNYGDPVKGERRRRDVEANFVKIVDYAIKQKADIFLLTGDIFDRVKPSNFVRSFLANQVKRLSDAGMAPQIGSLSLTNLAFEVPINTPTEPWVKVSPTEAFIS